MGDSVTGLVVAFVEEGVVVGAFVVACRVYRIGFLSEFYRVGASVCRRPKEKEAL